MKLNKILMAFAAVAMVGCSNEDVMDFSANQAPEDARMIQLDENFALAGVGEEGNKTRTHWEFNAEGALVNQFLPIYKAGAAADHKLSQDANLEAQAVGLCWLGNGAVGTDVYTNYQFYHFGWLNKEVTEADIDKCGTLYNGALYSEITMKLAGAEGKEAKPGTDWVDAGLPDKAKKAGVDNLNYNSGIYKTDNKAIFGGQYIVYYPFNPAFENAGTIPAVAKTTFSPVPAGVPADNAFKSPELGKETFRYSAPVPIEGGAQAAGFGMKNLSTLVQLRVATPAGVDLSAKSIDQIILYSPSEKLLKQANLAADKIAAGQTGEALYAETEGTKTITATFAAPVALKQTTADDVTSAYITVLPTTVNDLKVLVHNSTDGTWATIDMGNTVFEAGSAKVLRVSVTAADFVASFTAVDEKSLAQAIKEARAAIVADLTGTVKPTISVIGDITIKAESDFVGVIEAATHTFSINDANDAKITITGDDIIVPEGVTLNVKTNMESEVIVLGTSCCSGAAQGGILDIQGGTINDVTMVPSEARVTTDTYTALNPTVKFTTGASTVAADAEFNVLAGNVTVSNAVEFKGDINIVDDDAKLTVDATGDLNFKGGSVDNYGTIEVMKGGKFDMTSASGSTTAADGQRMTNEESGVFIHNVDAGVGTAVQNMHQNGEYRCRVNEQDKLNDAFLQWTACSVIEMVNAGAYSYDLGTAKGIPTKADGTTAWKHKGKYIDIEVNGAATTFVNMDDKGDGSGKYDNEVIQIGNLTVLKGGLEVNYDEGTGDKNGKRTLKVNGDMLVKAATTLTDSKKIEITGDLDVEGVALTYAGNKANVDGLAVGGDITVSGALGYFNASAKNAIKITCANFYLTDKAKAQFGLRTGSTDKTMTVTGTISNPKDCNFWMDAVGGGSDLLAWITCSTLIDGGNWTGARPIVE